MKRFLVLIAAFFAAPLSVSAETETAPACGLPYPVIELMHFVTEATEFTTSISGIAQGRLGMALEKIEVRELDVMVGEKLGSDAGSALDSLMVQAYALVNGEAPPEKGDVTRYTMILDQGGREPCKVHDAAMEGDDLQSDDADINAEHQEDTQTDATHSAGEAEHHGEDETHLATVVKDDVHENGDHDLDGHDAHHAASGAHTEPTMLAGGHVPNHTHEDPNAWLVDAAIIAVGTLFGLWWVSQYLAFRFGKKTCDIPMRLRIEEEDVMGNAILLKRKGVEFQSNAENTIEMFSKVNAELPHAITLTIGSLRLAGAIQWISSGDAKIDFDRPLSVWQFQSALDASLEESKPAKAKVAKPQKPKTLGRLGSLFRRRSSETVSVAE